MIKRCILFGFSIAVFTLGAQQPAASNGDEVLKGFAKHRTLINNSRVSALPVTCIGPEVMSGRVADIEVNPNHPKEFFVAYASGGLWYTVNNGQSFEPVFDHEASMSIGDIAVDWVHHRIWVGTGENNSSRSSYSGTGIYMSDDWGKSWQYKGLPESHHIGRIILHPEDTNKLWVAVTGHLYSSNAERGIYMTTDGGDSWQKVLYVDENTGGIDLAIDPSDAMDLYAAMWHRERKAWNFVECGSGSGIYKSTDGGLHWKKISGNGFPEGDFVGRIGLSVSPSNPRIIYASVDNQKRRPEEATKSDSLLTRDVLRSMSKTDFLSLDERKITAFLSANNFPAQYSATRVKAMIRKDSIEPKALVDYVEDANALLFDTQVTGLELYRSDDAGMTWHKTHKSYLDDVVFSYGYYFGQVRVSPVNSDIVYIVGVPVLVSDDGGASFKSINGDNVHVDHHALWVDPNDAGHLILGNDGGLVISYDNGTHWIRCDTPPVGQFYAVTVDQEQPYHVYGGLQDNGVWEGPSTHKPGSSWQMSGTYPYKMLLGGDGFQVAVDPRDNKTVYTGWQFGHYFRIDKQTGSMREITPHHKLGEHPYRFNWQTPIHLSTHNPDILYLGSNHLHRSMDQGKSWDLCSGDLTRGGKTGDVSYGTLTTIDESPLRFGLLYAGSDDGLVHLSIDAGYSWRLITKKLPSGLWVSRVEASAHSESRVYLALNGYRRDDFTSYLYMSEDYGENWQRIGLDLPQEAINVVCEDPVNENLLYVGTDHGAYISMDMGKSFMSLGEDLPNVPVHDMVIQKREKELVIATHGRSLYKMDVSAMEALTDSIATLPIFVFQPEQVSYSSNWGMSWSKWLDPVQPSMRINCYSSIGGDAELKVYSDSTLLVYQTSVHLSRGFNAIEYAFLVDSAQADAYKATRPLDETPYKPADDGHYYLRPGTYRLQLILGGKSAEEVLVVDDKSGH